MSENIRGRGKHARRYSGISTLIVLLILGLTGYMFSTNVHLNRYAVVSSDVEDLIRQRVAHVKALHEEVDKLSAKIDSVSQLIGTSGEESKTISKDGSLLPAVQGPGITVTLDDSPLASNADNLAGPDFNINDYVIHQQDVEAVINALWRGGAEAMMIQDQRVLASSAIICKGNVLALQGRQYSPPYTISAIGPIDGMKAALQKSRAIREYQTYVKAIGLGWRVAENPNMTFPSTSRIIKPLQYVTVVPKQ